MPTLTYGSSGVRNKHNKGISVNVLDTYNCDTQTLDDLMQRIFVVGDCVDLPDGIYANIEDTLAAVVMRGRFMAELEIYDQRGECRDE